MRRWIALAALLFPLVGLTCEGTDRRECKKQFRELVSYRAQAIDTAFGDLFGALPAEIQIKFVTAKDPEYVLFGGREGYDLKRRTLIFPRRVLGAKTPNPLRWAAYYWPFYQNEQYRLQFPVVEVIDNVLWNAFLQEAATARRAMAPQGMQRGRRRPASAVRDAGERHRRERQGAARAAVQRKSRRPDLAGRLRHAAQARVAHRPGISRRAALRRHHADQAADRRVRRAAHARLRRADSVPRRWRQPA